MDAGCEIAKDIAVEAHSDTDDVGNAHNEHSSRRQGVDKAGSIEGSFPLFQILADTEITFALTAIVLINLDITMLEGTLSIFLHDPSGPFHLSVAAIGMVYWSGLFELVGGFFSGHLGNAFGGWLILSLALICQGTFTALGPKDVLGVTVVSISIQGVGFGLADSCSNTIISLASDERFSGTGSVFALASACNQLGAIIGPVS